MHYNVLTRPNLSQNVYNSQRSELRSIHSLIDTYLIGIIDFQHDKTFSRGSELHEIVNGRFFSTVKFWKKSQSGRAISVGQLLFFSSPTLVLCIVQADKFLNLVPDRTSYHFWAWKSVDRRFWASKNWEVDGLRVSLFKYRSVGVHSRAEAQSRDISYF